MCVQDMLQSHFIKESFLAGIILKAVATACKASREQNAKVGVLQLVVVELN